MPMSADGVSTRQSRLGVTPTAARKPDLSLNRTATELAKAVDSKPAETSLEDEPAPAYRRGRVTVADAARVTVGHVRGAIPE